MQNHYSLLYREEEREMFPTLKVSPDLAVLGINPYSDVISAQHFGVGSIPWSPLGRGLLARPIGQDSARENSDRCVLSISMHSTGRESNLALQDDGPPQERRRPCHPEPVRAPLPFTPFMPAEHLTYLHSQRRRTC